MNEPKKYSRRVTRLAVLAGCNLLFTAVLATAALLYGWTNVARSLPALHGWHLNAPTSEFREADARKGYSLDDYLAQESQVFEELASLVSGAWAKESVGKFCRFSAASVCNPAKLLDRNWNRSFVLESAHPVGGALLIHGLSDSPYSLRALGERLHAEGYTVVGLRVPGHGTCPRALADARWQDWTAAVRVAVAGLRARLPQGSPLVLAGYSNGGALSVDYAISAAEDGALPRPDAVVLFSPMIGITPLAELTRLYRPVAWISGVEKAQWSQVSAEVDPFKYSSWPMNASVQAWKMTRRVEERLASLGKAGRMKALPPILAFQSAVDSTVVAPKLITALFERLQPGTGELVLFDVNRAAALENLLNLSFEDKVFPALKDGGLRFKLTLVTNVGADAPEVLARTRDGASFTETPLHLAWPKGVFSLSHLAVPISPGDPVLGAGEGTANTVPQLGTLSFRGEQGALLISDSLLVRMRYNPFYPFLEDHTMQWLKATLNARRPE